MHAIPEKTCVTPLTTQNFINYRQTVWVLLGSRMLYALHSGSASSFWSSAWPCKASSVLLCSTQATKRAHATPYGHTENVIEIVLACWHVRWCWYLRFSHLHNKRRQDLRAKFQRGFLDTPARLLNVDCDLAWKAACRAAQARHSLRMRSAQPRTGPSTDSTDW